MSVPEMLVALALLAAGAAMSTGIVAHLFPCKHERVKKLGSLLARGQGALARGDHATAESSSRRCIDLAERWFGAGTRYATEAWYDLLTLALYQRRDDLAAEAAAEVMRCAGEHEGLEPFAARGREELARARAKLGAVDEARELLDEAEAIRRARIPVTLAMNLEMRARVAFLNDDLTGATRAFESLLAGLGDAEPADGPYRSSSTAARDCLELDPIHIEEVLAGYARVLYLRNLDAEAEGVVARLIAQAKQADTIAERTPAMRLHSAALRLAHQGLVEGPRALALAGAELAGPRRALEMKLHAAGWAWQAGDWRNADAILRSAVTEGLDDAARAELLGALAFQSYSRGAHEEGERLLRGAQSRHPSFAPSVALLEARASSAFASGDREGASAIVESGLLCAAASDMARTVAGFWAFERCLGPLAARATASLRLTAQSSAPDAAERLRAGELERALALCDQARALDRRWHGGAGMFAAGLARLRSRVLREMGAHADARHETRHAIELLLEAHPDEHPVVAEAERHLAGFVEGAERRALLQRALGPMRLHGSDGVADVERELAALGD